MKHKLDVETAQRIVNLSDRINKLRKHVEYRNVSHPEDWEDHTKSMVKDHGILYALEQEDIDKINEFVAEVIEERIRLDKAELERIGVEN